jgi:hypothetical protein
MARAAFRSVATEKVICLARRAEWSKPAIERAATCFALLLRSSHLKEERADRPSARSAPHPLSIGLSVCAPLGNPQQSFRAMDAVTAGYMRPCAARMTQMGQAAAYSTSGLAGLGNSSPSSLTSSAWRWQPVFCMALFNWLRTVASAVPFSAAISAMLLPSDR